MTLFANTNDYGMNRKERDPTRPGYDNVSYRAPTTDGRNRLRETPVADRAKLDRSPLRQAPTGATMLFRRTDADRQVCRHVPFPGDPPSDLELRRQAAGERARTGRSALTKDLNAERAGVKTLCSHKFNEWGRCTLCGDKENS